MYETLLCHETLLFITSTNPKQSHFQFCINKTKNKHETLPGLSVLKFMTIATPYKSLSRANLSFHCSNIFHG